MEESKIFVSYSSKDSKEFTKRLCEDLTSNGIKVWLDQLEIKPGEIWDRAVQNALESSKKMLVILSPESVSSLNVMDELNFALEENYSIIPILHIPCKIPFRIRRRQYCDFTKNYDQGLKDLLEIGIRTNLNTRNPAISDNPIITDGGMYGLAYKEISNKQSDKQLVKNSKGDESNHTVLSISGYSEMASNEKSLEKRKNIYLQALKTYPYSPILWNEFTYFLHYVKKDFKDLDKYYEMAIKADPNYINNIANYAIYLKSIKKDYVEAEKYYLKVLAVNPENASINGNYAIFLKDIKKDFSGAERFYTKALKIDPEHANNNINYADYLKEIKKDYLNAEKYYLKALRLNPENANCNSSYAEFLKEIKKDYLKAEKYFLKALEIDPEHANSNGSYALFLKDIKKDYVNAEKYYLKALSINSQSTYLNCNYAIYLMSIKKDYLKAQQYLIKAVNNDPNDANCNGNYAQLLLILKKKSEASNYLDKALAASINSKSGLLLELWYYKYAHYPTALEESEIMIDKLLKEGIRSLYWYFDDNIRIAIEANHPDPKKLNDLANRITTE